MKLLKSIRKWLVNPKKSQVILLFLAWKIWILVFALLGLVFLPWHSSAFFGGGIENYSQYPLFLGWANFDGGQYLSIAQRGYIVSQHSYFPLYPYLMHILAPNSLFFLSLAGLAISHIAFFASLVLFWHLLRLDYTEKVSFIVIVTLLVFPTSFYFGAVYTESLFLFLALATFYAARKGNWLIAGLCGAVASATRIYGILLLPALFFEWFYQRELLGMQPRTLRGFFFFLPDALRQKIHEVAEKLKKSVGVSYWPLLPLLIIPLGLLAYMSYLASTTGDPFAFYTELATFGEQRGGGKIVLLYQVFWRYFKMIFTVTKSDPIYFTILMELATAILALSLLMWGYLKKVRPSYLVFAALGYILPTLTGSFSSLPRYVLVLFPLFIILGLFLSKRSNLVKIVLLSISAILLAIETILFIKGYWVA
ncbi:hypothetical protein CMO96_04530 [Candidatus Woesebacteria bacterium]|nr:hypothetical protein [Candidatus Woesebacteria bacterium]